MKDQEDGARDVICILAREVLLSSPRMTVMGRVHRRVLVVHARSVRGH